MRRLPFALPDFIRVAWVSDRAREVWEPRVRRLSRIWSAVEWLSVAAGLRPCAILRLSEQRLAHLEPRWRALSLDIARLSDAAAPLRVGLGSPPEVDELRAAWKHRAHDAIGALLGYPDCCREFFLATSIQRSFADPTWFMANGSSAEAGRVAVTVSGHPHANVLWRRLGVRLVPHLPCAFDCPATIDLGRHLLTVVDGMGGTAESNLFREMLSWPVEWSSLHGISETKTPILKMSSNTDAIDTKVVVRLSGTGYPDEGATGMGFPYRTRVVPPGRVVAYRRGLENQLGSARRSL